MTISKKLNPVHSFTAARALVAGAVLVSLAGCGMISSVVGGDKVDYKSAKKASTLDVPPDLTQLQKDNRYALPDAAPGVATASGYNAQRAAPAAGAAAVAASTAPVNSAIRVERSGNQRWLVVKQGSAVLWPQLKKFWEDSGFTLALDMQSAGIMETEWNENRAKIPQDFVRNTLGKVFDSLYSTGERDKFRTRLERLPDGSTEIYISHRGAEEVVTGSQKESTMWTARENDPGLEAQFLAKLMTQLGGNDAAESKTAVAAAVVQPLHAKLLGSANARYLEVDEGFDRAWRRVGLALDRVGFTVEDRDRNQGMYFVRYVDPDGVKAEGMFKKLFSWGAASDKEKKAERYRIAVKADAGATSRVTVLNNEGQVDTTATSGKILALLLEQLK